MSKFGNCKDFAIEAFVESELTPPSPPWGRLRIWVDGKSFGDFDDPHCGLFPAYDGFKSMLENFNDLYDQNLLELPTDELYEKIDKALYGVWVGEEFLDEEPEEGDELYWRHNFLTNWGEMFDRTEKSYVFKTDDGRLMVIQPKDDEPEIATYFCSANEFTKVVMQFLKWHDREVLRLSGKNV